MPSPNVDAERLSELIRGGESDIVEFKREWWDLTSSRGKGLLARHVLAMANTLGKGESAFLVFGVEDKKAGGAVVGVPTTPPEEAIAQILSIYTNPVPRIRLHELDYRGKRVNLLEIIWSEFQPHYATRDVDVDLSSDATYTRRAGTVGRLKPAEHEHLIRAREARLGKSVETSQLSAGFVELPILGLGARVVARVANVSEQPVTNINAFVDMILIYYPHAVYRRPLAINLTLGPGETRELDCQTSDADYYEGPGKPLKWKGYMWSTWLDLRLRLTYRGRDGILCEIVREASLG